MTEDTSLPFDESYCKLAAASDEEMLIIPNIKTNPTTASMDVTKNIGDASFFGIPITLRNGRVVGTICGLDEASVSLEQREIELIHSLADLFAYTLELEAVAFRDDLTDAYNRKFALQHLASTWTTNYHTAALIFVDIDNFKQINDEYGHLAGDNVLVATVKRLQAQTRPTDFLCRVGGDEFLVVILNYDNRHVLERIITGIMQAFSSPISVNDTTVDVSISVGISLFPEHGESLDALIQHADDAMYRVKRSGKNGYYIHHSDETGE